MRAISSTNRKGQIVPVNPSILLNLHISSSQNPNPNLPLCGFAGIDVLRGRGIVQQSKTTKPVWLALGFALSVLGSTAQAYSGSKSRFNMADLKQIVDAKEAPTSIEQVIDAVAAKSPDLFENFVLMYRSKSLQASSPLNPRALIYNYDASFILTFNGHASQRGFDRLELMQYDAKTFRFEFREVQIVDGKAKLSESNPKMCLACHQSATRVSVDPRPNWEPYSRWPGAIGSEQGSFSENFQKEIFRKEDAIHLQEVRQENNFLNAFLADVKPTHARYRHLKIPEQRSTLTAMPTVLTDLLGRLNFHRVMRLAKSDAPEHFEKISQVFTGVAKCGKFIAGEETLSAIEKLTPDETENFVVRASSMMRRRQRVPMEAWAGDGFQSRERYIMYPAKYPSLRISEGLFLLFETYGIDISDWSMDFRTNGRLAFEERFGLPSNPNQAASEAFSKVYPDLDTFSCENDVAVAEQQSEKMMSLPVQAQAPAKPLMDSCVRCHTDVFGVTPYIPFDQPTELKRSFSTYKTKSGKTLMADIEYRLSDHATLEEQMPKGLIRPLHAERVALIQYLEQLQTQTQGQQMARRY
jgi:hypothetical protein